MSTSLGNRREAVAVRLLASGGALPAVHRAQEACCELAADIARCRQVGGDLEEHIVGGVACLRVALAILEQVVDTGAIDDMEIVRLEELEDELEIIDLRRQETGGSAA